MATTDLRVTEGGYCLSISISDVAKTRFICNGRSRGRHRPTERGPTRSRTLFGSTEVPMRTPSRPTIALAMGGVFATIGLTGAAAASAAPAHPALARPAVAHHTARVLSLTVPGTGLRLSTSVDDEGNVEDVDEMENEDEVNDVDDADEVENEDEANDAGDDADEMDEVGDDQGEDNDDADEAGDDQGENEDADEADEVDNSGPGSVNSGHDDGDDDSGDGGG